jgi:hypothetical protein
MIKKDQKIIFAFYAHRCFFSYVGVFAISNTPLLSMFHWSKDSKWSFDPMRGVCDRKHP